MAEYSSEDARIAERLIVGFLDRQSQEIDLDRGLAISDVESDASEFSDELSLLEALGAEAPAMRVADKVIPVSLRFVFGAVGGWPLNFSGRLRDIFRWRHPFLDEFAYDFLRQGLRDEYLGLIRVNREEARSAFVQRSTDFLATRIASVRNWREKNRNEREWHGLSMLTFRRRIRGPQISTPGCTFTVTSNGGGLRVFWSGAYYISPNYFGHPTSPTSSVLQSGTYVFGVDGGAYGNQIQWDQNAVVSLPGAPHIHLNY